MPGFNPDQYLAEKTAAAPQPQAAAPGGFDPDAYLSEKLAPVTPEEDKMGTTEKLVRGAVDFVAPVAVPVGRVVDRFAGAPTRAAISAAQHHENPVEAFLNQFGEAPEQAPTGKEIAQDAGVSNEPMSKKFPSLYSETGKGLKLRKGGLLDPTAAGAAGFGIDVAADPLNFVGVGEIADAAKAVGKAGAKAAGKGIELGAKAADIATGTRAATGAIEGAKAAGEFAGGIASKVSEGTKNAINDLFKPKVAEDAGEMEKIAEKHGIPKDLLSASHEFGEDSTITELEKNIMEGAKGQKYREAHTQGIVKTSKALEENITSKFGKAPKLDSEAGQMIKDGVDGYISNVFDNADITYSSAAQKFPKLGVNAEAIDALKSKAIGLKREAARIARTSADPTQLAQAKNLEKWSNIILNSKGSYKEMSEIIQNVGKAAYAKTPLGQIPSDVKKLRELYDVGSESLIQSIRDVSPEAADQLVINNSNIKEMLSDKNVLGKIVQDAKNPESIYANLIERGGSKEIETLKKILPEQQFNQLRAKYLKDIIKYDKDGVTVNFGSSLRALQKNSDRLASLFTPAELQDTSELLKFGDRYGFPGNSTSKTGKSLGYRKFISNVFHGSSDEQILESMKAKARGGAASGNEAGGAAKAAEGVEQSAPVEGASRPPLSEATKRRESVKENSSGRPLIRDRSPMEQRLKAAQSFAPQTYIRPIKPKIGEQKKDEDRKPAEQKEGSPSGGNQEEPIRGPAKWVRDGFENLKAHNDKAMRGIPKSIVDNDKYRTLLIQASDLKPGTKAMEKIMERIKRAYGAPNSRG